LRLTPLRNAVIHSAWGRGKIDLPPGIAKKLNDTRVFVSSDVKESKFRKDRAKSLRVERVSDTAKNQKFKVKDERQASQPDTGRKDDMGRVSAEATKDSKKDNKEARQETRQVEQQQRKETRAQEKAQQPAQPKAQTQPKGERVGKPAKSEVKPQTPVAPKQERKQKPAAQPDAHGHGGGKGKGKKP